MYSVSHEIHCLLPTPQPGPWACGGLCPADRPPPLQHGVTSPSWSQCLSASQLHLTPVWRAGHENTFTSFTAFMGGWNSTTVEVTSNPSHSMTLIWRSMSHVKLVTNRYSTKSEASPPASFSILFFFFFCWKQQMNVLTSSTSAKNRSGKEQLARGNLLPPEKKCTWEWEMSR